MIKSVFVLVILALACNTYAEDFAPSSRCYGMATALELPDKPMFAAFIGFEQEELKKKYGVKSDKYTSAVLDNAIDAGYGNGYMKGLSHALGKDNILKVFVDSCYKGDNAFRDKILTENHLR